MVKVKEDLTGKFFGKLMVINQVEDYIQPNGSRSAQWLCQCTCPEQKYIIVTGSHLKSKHTQSCGCIRKEKASETHKKENKFDVTTYDYGVGWTNNTNNEFYFDLEDCNLIKDYCWYEHINKYNGYHALMANKHTKITNVLGLKGYGHVNRNPLDNRRVNLRKCNSNENAQNSTIRSDNTSGIVGVGWNKKSNKWRVRININGVQKQLGLFVDKNDAIRTRLNAELTYYGEFAPQRHLFEQYGIIKGSDIN